MSNIVITGVPGVGKTTVCRVIASKLSMQHINVSEYILEHKLYSRYDSAYDTYEFSTNKVGKHLVFNGPAILDTHTPEIFKKLKISHIFVLRISSIRDLRDRLLKRGYSIDKIDNNIDCELFNEIGFVVTDTFKNSEIHEIDTAFKSVDEISKIIIDKI